MRKCVAVVEKILSQNNKEGLLCLISEHTVKLQQTSRPASPEATTCDKVPCQTSEKRVNIGICLEKTDPLSPTLCDYYLHMDLRAKCKNNNLATIRGK